MTNQATDFLVLSANKRWDFAHAMNRFLPLAQRGRPHPSWPRLMQFDWDAELSRLTEWVTQTLEAEPPDEATNGFLFGLFNPVERGRPTAELYLAGYVDSGGGDWWDGEQSWWPRRRYARSRATRLTYRLAYAANGLQDDLEYPVGLVFSVLVARTLAATVDRKLWLRGTTTCHFAAGFDSGDVVAAGTLRTRGFTRAAS